MRIGQWLDKFWAKRQVVRTALFLFFFFTFCPMEVHRCRFVDYQPAAVNALDYTPESVANTRLAVGRANGDIEIWDPKFNWRLEKTIPGGQDLSVESLVWAHQQLSPDDLDSLSEHERDALRARHAAQPPRLFSSGLSPYIVEWDLTSMTVKVDPHHLSRCAA